MPRLHFLLYRIKAGLRRVLTGRLHPDDFDWDAYTDHYRGELGEIARTYSQIIGDGDYEFSAGHLVKKSGVLPLHPNARLVYETIMQLSPPSAMEMGCGGGDHLANLSILAPALRLTGADLSQRQIALLKNRHPGLKAEVRQFDLTSDPVANDLPRVDLAYTNAVLMHIRNREAYLTLHPEKTRIVGLWTGEEGFDFLGMHTGRRKRKRDRNVCITRPNNGSA